MKFLVRVTFFITMKFSFGGCLLLHNKRNQEKHENNYSVEKNCGITKHSYNVPCIQLLYQAKNMIFTFMSLDIV